MKGVDKLDHLSKYISYRIDIICQNPNRWLDYTKHDGWFNNSHYNLPTFEYYLENCINDKGGKYDFTVRRYKTKTIDIGLDKIQFEHRFFNKTKKKHIEYSIWMGTPFNFKEVIL